MPICGSSIRIFNPVLRELAAWLGPNDGCVYCSLQVRISDSCYLPHYWWSCPIWGLSTAASVETFELWDQEKLLVMSRHHLITSVGHDEYQTPGSISPLMYMFITLGFIITKCNEWNSEDWDAINKLLSSFSSFVNQSCISLTNVYQIMEMIWK